MKQKRGQHGHINERIDNGGTKQQNLQGTGITKKEAEKAMRNVSAVVSFDEGRVTVDKERYTE